MPRTRDPIWVHVDTGAMSCGFNATPAGPAATAAGGAETARRMSRVAARDLDHAAGIVSGLALEPIGLDGHSVANTLWKITAHLRSR